MILLLGLLGCTAGDDAVPTHVRDRPVPMVRWLPPGPTAEGKPLPEVRWGEVEPDPTLFTPPTDALQWREARFIRLSEPAEGPGPQALDRVRYRLATVLQRGDELVRQSQDLDVVLALAKPTHAALLGHARPGETWRLWERPGGEYVEEITVFEVLAGTDDDAPCAGEGLKPPQALYDIREVEWACLEPALVDEDDQLGVDDAVILRIRPTGCLSSSGNDPVYAHGDVHARDDGTVVVAPRACVVSTPARVRTHDCEGAGVIRIPMRVDREGELTIELAEHTLSLTVPGPARRVCTPWDGPEDDQAPIAAPPEARSW